MSAQGLMYFELENALLYRSNNGMVHRLFPCLVDATIEEIVNRRGGVLWLPKKETYLDENGLLPANSQIPAVITIASHYPMDNLAVNVFGRLEISKLYNHEFLYAELLGNNEISANAYVLTPKSPISIAQTDSHR